MQNRTTTIATNATIRTDVVARVDGSIFGDASPALVAHNVCRVTRADGSQTFEVRAASNGARVATANTAAAAHNAAVEAVQQAILDRDLGDTRAEDELVAALESLANSAGSVLASLEDPADAKYLRAAVNAADAVLAKRRALAAAAAAR